MAIESLAAALQHEHHEIDAGMGAFVAGMADGQPDGAALKRLLAAQRRHIYLEEAFVFPPLRAAGMMAPLLVMLREHGEMWNTMDQLERTAAGDPGSPETFTLCRELTAQMQHHNPKEEAVIYPQADQVLTDRDSHGLRVFLDSGDLPDGWVCARASR